MNMLMMPKLLLVVLAAASITGCATIFRDPRDAAWDPPRPQDMFTQIPAWDGAANQVCCGWRTDCEERKLSRRC